MTPTRREALTWATDELRQARAALRSARRHMDTAEATDLCHRTERLEEWTEGLLERTADRLASASGEEIKRRALSGQEPEDSEAIPLRRKVGG